MTTTMFGARNYYERADYAIGVTNGQIRVSLSVRSINEHRGATVSFPSDVARELAVDLIARADLIDPPHREDESRHGNVPDPDVDPVAGPCQSCGARIEPDDGGAIWFHRDNMSAFCDGDYSTDLTRQATPTDTAHAGEDGDDLPPAPELDALDRIREAYGKLPSAGTPRSDLWDFAFETNRILRSVNR